jgi:hypothetical protein
LPLAILVAFHEVLNGLPRLFDSESLP